MNKYQLEYKLETHEENIVRLTTTVDCLSKQIARMQTVIETMSETIRDRGLENRKVVRMYNELVKKSTAKEEAYAEKFIKKEFGIESTDN